MGLSLNRLTRGRQATQLRTDRQLGNGQGSAFRFRATASVMTASMLCSLAMSPGCQAPSQVIGFQHEANRDIITLTERPWGRERLVGFLQRGVGPTSIISAEGWKTKFFWKNESNESVAVECQWGKALAEAIEGKVGVYGRIVAALTKLPGTSRPLDDLFGLPASSSERDRILQRPVAVDPKLVGQLATESAKDVRETSAMRQIESQGIGNRFLIRTILPVKGDHVGSITIAQEGVVIGFRFWHTGDSVVVRRGRCLKGNPLPSPCWGSGSIIRFKGDVSFAEFRFAGGKNDPLAFALLKDVGFVHLCGNGTVTNLATGKVVRLTEDDSTGMVTQSVGPVSGTACSKVAVIVNGRPIPMDQVLDLLISCDGVELPGGKAAQETKGQAKAVLLPQYGLLQLTQQLIGSEVVRQKAEKQGLSVSDAELRAEHERSLTKMFGAGRQASQYENLLDQFLARKKMDREVWKMAIHRNALLDKLVASELEMKDGNLQMWDNRMKFRYQILAGLLRSAKIEYVHPLLKALADSAQMAQDAAKTKPPRTE